MGKDLFIIDTCCELNNSIAALFESKGYEVHVETGFNEVTDEVLKKADGFTALCIFVNKKILPQQVEILKANGNKLILCCSAGFDNVPLDEVKAAGMRVGRVPSYSPSSIAEFAISSILALSKNIQKSYVLCKDANFSIASLQCLLIEDKTIGVIGTGMIGKKSVEKLSHLCKEVLCFDAYPANDWINKIPNAKYVPMDELLQNSSVISVHVPLLKETHHLINKETISKMKDNVIIVNTSRGEIVNTPDLLEGLKSGKIFGAALDVFEGEKAFIFKDNRPTGGFSNVPVIKELASLDNVVLSSHIAFYTDEAIRQISEKTLSNYDGFTGKSDLDANAFVI